MDALRKSLLVVSVPLVLMVVVGTIRARVDEGRDQVLRDLKVFSEALYLVTNYYVEDVQLGQLERGAFQGLAESLDPWSSYWDPMRMSRLTERDESGDVGLLLVKTPQQYVAVAAVVPGSPADEAGVRRGQFLETIDELATKDLTLLEAQHMLRGPKGTAVTIGHFRQSATDDLGERIELVRVDPHPLGVVVDRPAEDAAVVRVTTLETGTAARVQAALAGLSEAGVSRLVLDLRDNVGGSPDEALAVADLFLGEATVFGERTREGTRLRETSPGAAWSGELVTLVDRGTVGEAELVAGALKAGGVGVLVGQPTFGKHSRQELVLLRDGAGLHLSVAQYLGPDGEPLEDDGVQPDEEVARGTAGEPAEAGGEETSPDEERAPAPEPGAEADSRDLQMERALEILTGGAERKAA